MVETLLQQLGFTANEIAVYLAVLENGKITPTDVAKRTGVNRTTVYSVAKELAKRGVMVVDLGGVNHYLVALPPRDARISPYLE